MKLNASQIFKVALCGLILFTILFRFSYHIHRIIDGIEMAAFIYLAFKAFDRQVILSYFWIASAIVVNPFIRLMLTRIMWPINTIWLTALVILILFDE